MTRANGPVGGPRAPKREGERRDALEGERVFASIFGAPFVAFLLRLILPRDRRDEFLGDLIEETRERLARTTRAETALWLWGQTLESIPALVVLRFRRRSSNAAPTLAAAAPALSHADVGRAFQAFLQNTHGHSRRRPIAVGLSLMAHAAVLALGVAWTALSVDEMKGPMLDERVPLVIYAQPKPVDSAPPGVRPKPTRRKNEHKVEKTLTFVTTAPPTVTETAKPTGETLDPPGDTDGPPTAEKSDIGGTCATGACASTHVEQTFNLPPTIAEKRCLSCPPPRLPPAFMQMGQRQVIETRICIAADGGVASCQILQGIDASADAGVCQMVRSWRLAPFQVNGHAVPFCYRSRFVFVRQ